MHVDQAAALPSDDMHNSDCSEPVPEGSITSDDEDILEYYGEGLDDCGMWEDVERDVDDEAAFTAETTVLSRSSQSHKGPVEVSALTGNRDDDDERSKAGLSDANSEYAADGDEKEAADAIATGAGNERLKVIWDHLVSYKVGSRVLSELFMEHPSEDQAPGYDEMISDYIDLNMIRDKLDEPAYSFDRMQCDMKLLKSNAESFNQEGSQICLDVNTLYNQFLALSTSDPGVSAGDSLGKEVDLTGEAEYVVEKILRERVNGDGVKEYQVRWQGYGENEDTWEPKAKLKDTECLSEYMKQKSNMLTAPPEVAEDDNGEHSDEGGFVLSGDEEDKDEGESSVVENESDEVQEGDRSEEEMNDEDRDFIVEDGMAEDSSDDDADADDAMVDDDVSAADNDKPARASRTRDNGDSKSY
jgi:hypothetical protein